MALLKTFFCDACFVSFQYRTVYNVQIKELCRVGPCLPEHRNFFTDICMRDRQGNSTPPFPTDNEKPKRPPQLWFVTGDQNFKSVKQSGKFVDHSLLLEKLLCHYRRNHGKMPYRPILVTAPRRFGKSTNLSMVKHFLEIELDENGIPIKGPKDLKEPVTNTVNYKLFENMKIMQHKDAAELVKEHFGRHPVIHLDLKGIAGISNADDVLMHCREVLHTAFEQHKYLQGNLEDSENKLFSSWYDIYEYPEIPKHFVLNGLLYLAKLLHTYFQRKVFILVDEYDCVPRTIISQCRDQLEVQKGIDIYMTMLGNAIKGQNVIKCVQGAMLTGISYIGGFGLSDTLNNVIPYRFLGDHEFVKFYGLTESEVQCIAQEYANIPENNVNLKELTDWYDGYESKRGEKIYSIWSVGNALNADNVSNFWKNTGQFHQLVELIKIPQVTVHILKLLNGQHLTFRLLEKVTAKDIISLNNEIIPTKLPSLDLLFSMMLEEGYLTIVKENKQEDRDVVTVKVPNNEIKSEIRDRLAEHFQINCGFDNIKIMQCASFFDNIKSFETQNADFKVVLKEFRDNLAELFQRFSPGKMLNFNENHLHCLMYMISGNTDYIRGTEFHVNKVGRVDLKMASYGEFSVIMELKYNKTEGSNTGDKNKKSREALLQILNPKSQYMSILTERNIKKYFLIGLSIDDYKTPHLSCLLNSTDFELAYHL